jgi:hypothetical protein
VGKAMMRDFSEVRPFENVLPLLRGVLLCFSALRRRTRNASRHCRVGPPHALKHP